MLTALFLFPLLILLLMRQDLLKVQFIEPLPFLHRSLLLLTKHFRSNTLIRLLHTFVKSLFTANFIEIFFWLLLLLQQKQVIFSHYFQTLFNRLLSSFDFHNSGGFSLLPFRVECRLLLRLLTLFEFFSIKLAQRIVFLHLLNELEMLCVGKKAKLLKLLA